MHDFLLNNDFLRNFFSGRRRFKLAWLVAFILVFFVRQYPEWPGVFLCFLGSLLRFISSGYLRKEQSLAVGGPYQFTRNPLYFGTLMMAAGAIWAVSTWWVSLLVTLLLSLNYYYVIEFEESMLPQYFGEAYLKYCGLVPRFWPRLSFPSKNELLQINSNEAVYRFSWSLAMKNRAFEAVWSFIGLIFGISLVYWIKQQVL